MFTNKRKKKYQKFVDTNGSVIRTSDLRESKEKKKEREREKLTIAQWYLLHDSRNKGGKIVNIKNIYTKAKYEAKYVQR